MNFPPFPPFARTDSASFLTPYANQTVYSSLRASGCLVASPLESQNAPSTTSRVHGWPLNDVQFHLGATLPQPYLNPGQGENTVPPLPSDYTSGQDTRDESGPRQWSSFATSYATPQSQLPSAITESHSSHGVLNGFTGSFAPIDESQLIPDLGPNLPNLIGYHHANLGTDLDQPTYPINNVSASPSDFVSNERQPPVMIYRARKKGAGRRPACAINIQGMWIDKKDLYSSASKDNPMIGLHECQWAKSSDPCGMWIVGSKLCISAHIREWHRQEHTGSTVKSRCLWDGCTCKVMRKDSISRHIISVHLEEGFHCQGCDREFSRRDVYDKHAQNGEPVCRDAGAAIAYGAEHRLIDAARHCNKEELLSVTQVYRL